MALHAAAAIQTLAPAAVERLRAWLRDDDPRRAAVAAALLTHHGRVEELVDAASENGSARLWAIRALGDLPPHEAHEKAGGKLTPRLLEELEPLWVQHRDWLRTPENEGALPLLAEQQMRFEPTNP